MEEIKLVDDILIDENYDPAEIFQLLMIAYSQSEREIINTLLFEDFKQILLNNPPSDSEMFKKARYVSSFGYDSRISVYCNLRDFTIDHLKHKTKQNILSTEKLSFIRSFVGAWSTFIDAIYKINNVMDHMETIHLSSYQLRHFDKLGILLFRKLIFEDDSVRTRLKQDLAEMNQPALFMSNRLFIEDLINMCIVLKQHSMNKIYVIPLMLDQSSKYFQSLSEDYLFKYCACSYFKNVEAKINEEKNRIYNKFDIQTGIEFVDMMKTELVIKNMKTIVEMENCGVVYMLKNKQFGDLKCMYKFLSSVNGGKNVMFDGMRPYIREVGTSVVLGIKENSDGNACIQSLLDLKGQFDHLKVNLFNNDRLFDEIVGDEFDDFLKSNPIIPEYLSIFIDRHLRKRKHAMCIEEANINRVIFMIKYLKDKCTFQRFYFRMSCQRLMLPNSDNFTEEKKMISKLKWAYLNSNGCPLFIPKLDGMVKDKFVLSRMVMSNYRQRVFVDKCIFGTSRPFDLNVQVIDPEVWSINPEEREIPAFALSAFNDFQTLYKQHDDQKKLIILPQYGTVELSAVFYDTPLSTKRPWTNENSTNVIKRAGRKINLVISTYQMCVLDLFNTHSTLTFQEIQRETKIDEKSLVSELKAMVFGKRLNQLLLKNPMVQKIEKTDRFHVNESFAL